MQLKSKKTGEKHIKTLELIPSFICKLKQLALIKPFIVLAILTLASSFAANAQNVGIGNTSPDEKLHVTGKVKIEHALVVKPVNKNAAATISISSDDGFVVIAYVYGTQANAISMAGIPTEGQILTIRNDDTDDATFSGTTISASTTLQLIYTNSTWKKVGGSSVVATTTAIADTDNDTKIQVEKTTDDDIIRFDLGGTQKWQMLGSRLEPVNTGNSIFIGNWAGKNDDLSANLNNGIGAGALYSNTTGDNNVANGFSTLYTNTTGSKNTAIGSYTMNKNTTGFENVAVGYYAMRFNTTGNYNSAMGSFALYRNTTGLNNVAIGANVLLDNTTGDNNTASGFQSAENNTTGNNNTAYGYQALHRNSTGSNNVALGYKAGYYETGSNKLYIANGSGIPLIYGNFDNDLVRIYGTLNINNSFSFPTVDGSTGQVLATDGSGTLSWTAISSTSATITDADNDTKIQVEENTDEDVIRFDIGGKEKWRMTGSRLEPLNSGGSVFIGEGAGLNDYLIYNKNVGIGYNSLYSNTSGGDNTAIGMRSLEDNTTGYYNVANGNYALASNTTGSNNVAIGWAALKDVTTGENNVAIGTSALRDAGSYNTAIGYRALSNSTGVGNYNVALGYLAGLSETGSHKLYIANSDTINPLIYGEFDNSILKINGELRASGGLTDDDGDTKIQVEESADEDIIRFDLGGTEKWVMEGSRLEPLNTGNSTFIGFEAGLNDDLSTNSNTAIGNRSMYSTTTGYNSVAMGSLTMFKNTTGIQNVAIGNAALYANTTGSSNVAIGNAALISTTGSGNVAIGTSAGFYETGSNKLYIDNSNTSSPLIYGDFYTNLLEINGNLRPGSNNTRSLGSSTKKWTAVYATNGTIQTSDIRFKKNIIDMNYGLNDLMKLRSVTYQWKEDSLGETKLGFIAQELEQIVPEVVTIANDSMQTRGVNYAELIPVLVKAIQEQQQIIENAKLKIENYEAKIENSEAMNISQNKRLADLEAKLSLLLNVNTVSK